MLNGYEGQIVTIRCIDTTGAGYATIKDAAGGSGQFQLPGDQVCSALNEHTFIFSGDAWHQIAESNN